MRHLIPTNWTVQSSDQQGAEVTQTRGEWPSRLWARAAAPALAAIRTESGRMESDATVHHADYVGDDRWVVSYLPGRQFDFRSARIAMLIAIAPVEWPDVERWAAKLGLTANEARQFVAVA